jgi:hypothetical protein
LCPLLLPHKQFNRGAQVSDTPRTDACFEKAKELILKYGTREGVGCEFDEGNPWLLAHRLERELNEAKRDAIRALAAQLRQQKGAEQNDR